MRNIAYVVLGGVGGEFPKQGTVADLLSSVPYLLMSKVIPPLHVTNDLLLRGLVDAGMSGGCRWEPFQISQEEWVELVEHLTSLPDDKACDFVQPPDWVTSIDDWHSWIMTYRHGFPQEIRELDREERRLKQEIEKALSEGNQALVEELHLQRIAVGNKVAEFAMEANRRRKRK